jgi:hypothetical protein
MLKSLYNSKIELIICGDVNINYLTDAHRKNQLNSLRVSYNLFGMVNFPTRLQNNSISAIYNIFIDYSRQGNCEISPIYNGLSNHNAQLISIQDVNLHVQTYNIQHITKINKPTLAEFNYNLSFVTWEDIFDDSDVDSMLNSFLNTFVTLFYFTFPKIKKTCTIVKSNRWITPTIKTLCCFKRDLYLLTKN